MQRFFQFILLLGMALCLMGIGLFFRKGTIPLQGEPSPLFTQNSNTYLGPHSPSRSQLIQIQILVNDDPSPQGKEIVSAQFDGRSIPLKPRDIYGFRGQASFQLPPGKYKLSWKVNQDHFAWPRNTSHVEEVNLDPRDLWIQITITGDKATLS